MKKDYIRLTAIITSIIFFAFVLIGGLYTYATATKIMNVKMALAENHTLISPIAREDDYTDNLIHMAYYDFKLQSRFHKYDDIGFYGMIKLDDGKVVESGDFVEICSDLDNPGVYSRFFPVSSDFKSDSAFIYSFDIDAMCDDNLIFNGKFTYVDKDPKNTVEYTIGDNELASVENAVPVSEWQGDKFLYAEYYKMAQTKYEAKLDKQAKKQLAEVRSKIDKGYVFKVYQDAYTFYYVGQASDDEGSMQKKIDSGQVVSFVQYKLGTSYYITHSCINSSTDNAFLCYVFHPLELAFRSHIFLYIMSLIAFIIIEAFVIVMMRKMYGNQMSYELMRQDLTRSIAHDLKTPLAVTKAYTENWEYIDEEDRHEYAEKLNAEVDNMVSVINNMLNMSKLDSEKDIKLEEVELYSMTSEIYDRMKPIINERGLNVKLVTDVLGGKYVAYADPKMIGITMGNFITNAVKYAESRVDIKLLSNEKKITFMVTNDGQCISKKEIKRIWEPFYKGDKARTDRMGSSGIGLAINSSILKLHKAKYKCISSNNETSFWFELKKVK